MQRQILALLFLASSASLRAQPVVRAQLDPQVQGPRVEIGIGVNGGGGWRHLVSANLVDDSSFEGDADDNGFARAGWPWAPSGDLVGSVDRSTQVSGAQSQKIVVNTAPAAIGQGRVSLPQLPHTFAARAGHTYRIKVQAKASVAGARIRLGVVDEGWQRRVGPDLAVGTEWQVYTFDYQPASTHLLRGFAVEFVDAGTYWLDDLVAWDPADIDATTGLSATFVARLGELQPATLRLGGLGVNGIPLESYLRRWWDRSYGPPSLQPDMDLNTFLLLCQRVGAQPFITVPPAFSDDTHWQLGDLSDAVIDGVTVDHGNLVDYLGGDSSTVYGARREADGFSRWDLAFARIDLELGNELWGTPDDRWDMDPNGDETQAQQMDNYATYCQRRIAEMKGRPGWRANMRVGFGGRGPETWIGGWPGSYDGTLLPALDGLTDFSTIDLYYGAGSASDDDATIYGALFGFAHGYQRSIAAMRSAFSQALGGVDLPTVVYEGNVTWGGYESDLSNPSPLYFKTQSLGAAVSLLDVYAAANQAGVTVINHFHYGGNVWSTTGPYPQVWRKPSFFALKLYNTEVQGDRVGCTLDGVGHYDAPLTGETGVPLLACYAYRQGARWSLLFINRDLGSTTAVRVDARLAPLRQVLLSGNDPALNNESGEQVQLLTTELDGRLVDAVHLNVPPFSALLLVASETGASGTDAGVLDGASMVDGASTADGASMADGALVDGARPADGAAAVGDAVTSDAAMTDADPTTDSGSDNAARTGSGCACGAHAAPGSALPGGWLVLALGLARKRRLST